MAGNGSLVGRWGALATLIAVCWVIEIVNFMLGHRLNAFGVLPRHLSGLPGIVTAPVLHAGFGHLLSNTGGLLILGGLTQLQGNRRFIEVTLIVALVGGVLVWLLARGAYHVGASGLVFGYFGYLVARGYYRRSLISIVVAAGVVLMFGGLLHGLLPLQTHVSWEGHLFGLLSGVFAAWVLGRA